MVIAFGVSIQAGSGSDGDGGVNPMKPMTATIYVDSFWLEGSCGGTGGTGGGTAGTRARAARRGRRHGAARPARAARRRHGGHGRRGRRHAGTGGAVGGTAGTGGAAPARPAATGTGGAGGDDAMTSGGGHSGLGHDDQGATVAAATEQHFDGAQSLKITHGALDNANILATSTFRRLWPGTVLTLHAYLPTGFDTSGAHYFQAIAPVEQLQRSSTRPATARAPRRRARRTPGRIRSHNTFQGGFQTLPGSSSATIRPASRSRRAVRLPRPHITATGRNAELRCRDRNGRAYLRSGTRCERLQDGRIADTVARNRPTDVTGSRLVEGRVHGAPGSSVTSNDRAQGLHRRR